MSVRFEFILLLIMILGAAACTPPPATATTATTPTRPPEITAEATSELSSEWVEFEVNGVRLGIQKPAGWEVRQTSEGVMLAEQFGSVSSGMDSLYGLQIHLFVHSLDEFVLPADVNIAWAVLEQIIHKPSYIGNGQVSDPQGFEWDQHDAAYYLLNNGDGSVTMLIALALPSQQMVVLNISSPMNKARRIRRLLPVVLSSLTIDGNALDGAALSRLPEELEFPDYRVPTPTVEP